MRARRPAALLLPGLDGSGRLFAPFLAAGPTAFEPVTLSYPPREPLGYDALLGRVRAALPEGPFLLLAESFSGPLAIRLAAERPRGLVAVILAATFLHRPLGPILHPVRGLVSPALFRLPMPAAVIRALMAGPGAPDAMVEEVQRAVAAVDPEVMALRAAEALAVDVREALAGVAAPLLFLAPTRDRLIRTDAWEDVALQRPDAAVVKVASPHMVLQRCPHACLAAIEAFLAAPRGGGARRRRAPGARPRSRGRGAARASPSRARTAR